MTRSIAEHQGGRSEIYCTQLNYAQWVATEHGFYIINIPAFLAPTII